MLSSCTPSEVVRTLRYVFFGCFCYQSSCLLIYLGTGVFIQMAVRRSWGGGRAGLTLNT